MEHRRIPRRSGEIPPNRGHFPRIDVEVISLDEGPGELCTGPCSSRSYSSWDNAEERKTGCRRAESETPEMSYGAIVASSSHHVGRLELSKKENPHWKPPPRPARKRRIASDFSHKLEIDVPPPRIDRPAP